MRLDGELVKAQSVRCHYREGGGGEEEDLSFDRAITLINELRTFAHERDHAFGIKLTNTLVVNNHKDWMPDQTMYLSGPPLHVLASALLDKLSAALDRLKSLA